MLFFKEYFTKNMTILKILSSFSQAVPNPYAVIISMEYKKGYFTRALYKLYTFT